jgi:hypothetical protein
MLLPLDIKSIIKYSKSHAIEIKHSIGEMVSNKIYLKFYKPKKYMIMPHMEQLPKKPILINFLPTKLKRKS